MTFNIVLAFGCILLVGIFPRFNGDENAREIWETAGLTPTPIQNLPPTIAEVVFPNNVVISISQALTVSQVAVQPVSIGYPYFPNDLYTFMMFDSGSLYLQWLSANNLGSGGNQLNTYSGQNILEYFAPGPAQGSGRHDYVVLVFRQSITFDDQAPSRDSFNYFDFANKYSMSLVAGTFFAIYA